MLHCKGGYFYRIFNNICILGFFSAWGSGSCGGGDTISEVSLMGEVGDVSNAPWEAECHMVPCD